MEPQLGFMERLAALLPRPRLHLIRVHGVLAPKVRSGPELFPVRQNLQPSFPALTQ